MMQTMPQWNGEWSPFAGRRPALGYGVPGRRPALACAGGTGGTECPAEGRHWPALGPGGTECPAEGRHWPALGARRSAGLPAEGRRWLGRRPGTAARAMCARRSEQCAMF